MYGAGMMKNRYRYLQMIGQRQTSSFVNGRSFNRVSDVINKLNVENQYLNNNVIQLMRENMHLKGQIGVQKKQKTEERTIKYSSVDHSKRTRVGSNQREKVDKDNFMSLKECKPEQPKTHKPYQLIRPASSHSLSNYSKRQTIKREDTRTIEPSIKSPTFIDELSDERMVGSGKRESRGQQKYKVQKANKYNYETSDVKKEKTVDIQQKARLQARPVSYSQASEENNKRQVKNEMNQKPKKKYIELSFKKKKVNEEVDKEEVKDRPKKNNSPYLIGMEVKRDGEDGDSQMARSNKMYLNGNYGSKKQTGSPYSLISPPHY